MTSDAGVAFDLILCYVCVHHRRLFAEGTLTALCRLVPGGIVKDARKRKPYPVAIGSLPHSHPKPRTKQQA
jgi:hypothetical protein